MPDADKSDTRVDLTNCDREPIHRPGAILPHGAMLVLDCVTLTMLQAAGDTEALLGQPLAGLLGRGMETLLRPDQIGLLRVLGAEPGLTRPRYLLDPTLRVAADRPVDASVYRSGELLVVEFEAANPADRFASDPLLAVHGMLEGLDRAPSVAAICQAAAERVRRITGYDRVMVYRFLEDESGEVIAECKREDLPSFLDLHYPESDIPRQARALYLKSPLRLITQVDYDPAPLVPAENPLTGEALDMSFATLRDVSPVHREYLRNMGVDASMSVSIILKGRLWGLIACHHGTPLRLPRHLRAVCELFGSMLSLQLDVQVGREQFSGRLKSRDVLQRLMLNLAVEEAYAPGIANRSSDLLAYIQADGLCLFEDTGGGPVSFGRTPAPGDLAALIAWLSRRMDGEDPVFATDRLREVWPAARAYSETASGLLAILVSREPRRFILWFRTEIVHTVTWGGDPTKPVNPEPNINRLSPRASFDAWKQTVHGRSRPWTSSDHDAALDLRVALLEVVLRRIEAAAAERQRAHEHEKLLIAELDHRVKNTLGVIQSLVVQTSRSATSMTDFVTGLERRIRSMAQSHSLLTRSHWNGVEIQALLREELDQYGLDGAAVTLSGPDLVLTPKAALALSLAIHELATNAAKYGALSTCQGAVTVRWGAAPNRGIELFWRESGGPAVSPPQQRGFGSRLIEQALTMETGGRSMIRFSGDGVQCDIVLPASSIAGGFPDSLTADAARVPDAEPPAAPRRTRPRVLIVEDSYLIALLLEQVLEDQDWELVGPATRVSAALGLARTERIDAALLDINLDGEMSWPVAMALRERGVPFAFSTGYGSAADLPEALADVLVLKKPFQLSEVENRLHEMLRSRTGRLI
jgi:light-regulated signal transduction histidine kinase (bacteriophytochrome)